MRLLKISGLFFFVALVLFGPYKAVAQSPFKPGKPGNSGDKSTIRCEDYAVRILKEAGACTTKIASNPKSSDPEKRMPLGRGKMISIPPVYVENKDDPCSQKESKNSIARKNFSVDINSWNKLPVLGEGSDKMVMLISQSSFSDRTELGIEKTILEFDVVEERSEVIDGNRLPVLYCIPKGVKIEMHVPHNERNESSFIAKASPSADCEPEISMEMGVKAEQLTKISKRAKKACKSMAQIPAPQNGGLADSEVKVKASEAVPHFMKDTPFTAETLN